MSRLAIICIFLPLAFACKPRNTSTLADADSSASSQIDTVEKARRMIDITTAFSQKTRPTAADQIEAEMASLTFMSLFLGEVEAFKNAVETADKAVPAINAYLAKTGKKPVGLQLADDLNIDEQRFKQEMANRDAALKEAQAIMANQNSMREHALRSQQANNDYSLRHAQFLQTMDKQNFDQRLQAAETAVELEGKVIENQGKILENKKKAIENEFLATFASAYNFYARSYAVYTSTVSNALTGAGKSTRIAKKLLNSVTEFDDRVKRCTSSISRAVLSKLSESLKLARTEDYTKVSVGNPKGVRDRFDYFSEIPFGKQCLELGFHAADASQYSDYENSKYAEEYPVMYLNYLQTDKKLPLAARNNPLACPAVVKGSGLPLLERVNAMKEYTAKINRISNNLSTIIADTNSGGAPDPTAPADSKIVANDSTGTEEFREATIHPINLTTHKGTRIAGRPEKISFTPIPVTLYDLALGIGQYYTVRSSPSDFPGLCDTSSDDFLAYIEAKRSYQKARMKKMVQEINAARVIFVDDGSDMFSSAEPLRTTAGSELPGSQSSFILQVGFRNARYCVDKVLKSLEDGTDLKAPTLAELPKPREAKFGNQTFNFFYPPYQIGASQTATEDKVADNVRHCVDNAMQSLANAQQSLSAVGEFHKYFSEAAAIKAPASPIPPVVNPAPGTTFIGR
jgi:hypothetical protein